MLLPTYDNVVLAAQTLQGHAHKTPVMRSRQADHGAGAELFFKCENFQRMGAFKFRGAYHALSQLTPEQRQAGVVTFSSGNHAQAIALAAQLLHIQATIVMPHDAPKSKIAATQGYGGKTIFYDRIHQDREAITNELAQQHGMTLIPPFDHPDIIAGAGTAAKELLEEVGPLDAIFVSVGGGGFLSGSALATRALAPQCKIYGVEPLAGNDAQQSFRTGERVRIPTPQTIADGAQTQQLGRATFEIIRRDVTDVVTVSDQEIINAMRFFAQRMKMVVEPTGAMTYAAACQMSQALQGQRVGILISGGNVDLERFYALTVPTPAHAE